MAVGGAASFLTQCTHLLPPRTSPQLFNLTDSSQCRAVVERPLIDSALLRRLPARFKAAARQALLCLNRPAVTEDRREVSLTPDVVAVILQKAAFPVSPWASEAWLRPKRVREPTPRPPSPAAAQAGGGGGVDGGQPQGLPGLLAGLPPGAHVAAPGEEIPPFSQALMQAVQQQLPAGAGPPHLIVMPHPPGQQPGQGLPPGLAGLFPPPPAGAAPVAPAGAAAPGGGAPGVQMLQHQQHQHGNQHFHMMQVGSVAGGVGGERGVPQLSFRVGQALLLPAPPR